MSEAFIAFEKADFRMKGAHATSPKTWRDLPTEGQEPPVQHADQCEHREGADAGDTPADADIAQKKLKSSEVVGKTVGVSSRTINKFRRIKDWAYESDLERFRRGEISLKQCLELAEVAKIARSQLREDMKVPETKKLSLMIVLKNLCNEVFHRVLDDEDKSPSQLGRELLLRRVVESLFKAHLLGAAEVRELREDIRVLGK
jgi:hypothetical protein